jgi:hypothetical protein
VEEAPFLALEHKASQPVSCISSSVDSDSIGADLGGQGCASTAKFAHPGHDGESEEEVASPLGQGDQPR